MNRCVVDIIIITILWIVLYGLYRILVVYFARKRMRKMAEQEEQRRVEIREILKNKLIVLNQVAIKIAAEEFMQALLDWKSERTIRETIAPYRPEWGEQEILNCIERSESLINPIIKVYQPVYDVAIQKKIDQPFDLSGYIHSFFTGFYWSEVDYPEIDKPLSKLSELMRGGLSHEEFWETDYYKKHLVPKKVQERMEELRKIGKY